MITEYRGAFESFVKNKSLGPFAKKTKLNQEQVQKELDGFQKTRDTYQSLDQSPDDQNRVPGEVKVPTETAFPRPPLSAEDQRFADMLDQAMEGIMEPVQPDDQMLNISFDENSLEVEESGLRPGVSFTKTDGNDTYYMNVSFQETTDIVEALHLNSANGEGTIFNLQYVLPEDKPEEPQGTVIKEFSGFNIHRDEDGIIRLGDA